MEMMGITSCSDRLHQEARNYVPHSDLFMIKILKDCLGSSDEMLEQIVVAPEKTGQNSPLLLAWGSGKLSGLFIHIQNQLIKTADQCIQVVGACVSDGDWSIMEGSHLGAYRGRTAWIGANTHMSIHFEFLRWHPIPSSLTSQHPGAFLSPCFDSRCYSM